MEQYSHKLNLDTIWEWHNRQTNRNLISSLRPESESRKRNMRKILQDCKVVVSVCTFATLCSGPHQHKLKFCGACVCKKKHAAINGQVGKPKDLSCDWSTQFMKAILLGLSLDCSINVQQYKHSMYTTTIMCRWCQVVKQCLCVCVSPFILVVYIHISTVHLYKLCTVVQYIYI